MQCENKNSKDDLHKLECRILENLKNIESAPSVPFHNVPEAFFFGMQDENTEHIDEERNFYRSDFLETS